MVIKTLSDALKEGIALLNEVNIKTAGLDARMLMCHVLGCDKLYLTVHKDDVLMGEDLKNYFELVSRRKESEPVSYITGTKEFMSLSFDVDENVLIPRPDTEIVTERVINEINTPNPVIIDMCTGSGAIAVSLAKYIEGASVIALDISDGALKIAKRNAVKNGTDVKFEKHDVLTPYTKLKADAVVSNPPYIPQKDLSGLQKDVIKFEPRLALDGGDDGLVFYKAIIQNIGSCLKEGGLLAFEVGCGQAEDVAKLMQAQFTHIGVEKDLAGIDRAVYGIFTPDKELL